MSNAMQTSALLRSKAAALIKKANRPLTAREIVSQIRHRDVELYNQISSKCNDYVRIILSVESNGALIKYRSLKLISGVDKRSIFYGCSGVEYPKTEWILCEPEKKNDRKRKPKPTEKIIEPKNPIVPKIEEEAVPISAIEFNAPPASLFDFSDTYDSSLLDLSIEAFVASEFKGSSLFD